MAHYDFSARIYNPSLGRFLSVDPLTGKFPHESPYTYVSNNPLRYTDPTGMEKDDIIYRDQDTGQEMFREKQAGKDIYIDVAVATIRSGSNGSSNYGDTEVGILGSVASAYKFDMYNKTQWKGANGQYFNVDAAPGKSKPFTGNQHTGSVNKAKSKAAKVGAFGTGLSIYSVYATDVEYIKNKSRGYGINMTRHIESRYMKDQAMNGVGFLKFYGAILSLGYNAGHMIENLCNCNIQYNPLTKDFTPIEQTLQEYDALGIDLAPLKK